MGAVVRRLCRLPARPACDLPSAPTGDRSRHARRRHDAGSRSTARLVYRGTATGALSELVVVEERVALPTGGGVSARACSAPRLRRPDRRRRRSLRGSCPGGRVSARGRGRRRGTVRDPGRASRRGRPNPLGRPASGATVAGAELGRDPRRGTRRPAGRAPRGRAHGRRLRVRRRRRSDDDAVRAPSHAQRRDDGDRRPTGRGETARSRSERAHPPRQAPHGLDLRIVGPGCRDASAARARPRGTARPRLARGAGVPARPAERRDGGERRGRPGGCSSVRTCSGSTGRPWRQ